MGTMGDHFFEASAEGRVKAKVCGITRADQASAIAEMGADAVGINFWPKSKRYIALDAARDWLAELEGVVTRVGVFVNAGADELQAAFASGLLDALQLHGDESAEFVAALIERGLPVFKAHGGKDASLIDEAAGFPGEAILLDAYAPTEYGGTGATMDWALGARVVEAESERQVILAGGLKPENVAAAIAQVHPFAVDVASGVESAPGVKDLDQVRAFLAAVAEAG